MFDAVSAEPAPAETAQPTNGARALAFCNRGDPKAYGKPRVQFIRRSLVVKVLAYRLGTWETGQAARGLICPQLPQSKAGRDRRIRPRRRPQVLRLG